MLSLDLLGAGEGLSTQTVLVRVRKIDTDKLKTVTKGTAGHFLSPALAVVDQFPKAALDIALPLAQKELEKIGVTADLNVTNSPPPPRPPAESKAAFVAGAVLGVALTFGGRWVYHRVSSLFNRHKDRE